MNAAFLSLDIDDDIERGEETLVVTLDLENRIQYSALLRTMIRIHMDPQLVLWIGEGLLKRNVAFQLGTQQ